MDIFKHNWTDRMKKEPYINKVLNFTPPDQIVLKNVTKYMRKKHRFVEEKLPYPYTKKNHYEVVTFLKDNPPVRRDFMEHKDVQTESFDLVRNGQVLDEYPLYDNTRPNSLYNLRYASMR